MFGWHIVTQLDEVLGKLRIPLEAHAERCIESWNDCALCTGLATELLSLPFPFRHAVVEHTVRQSGIPGPTENEWAHPAIIYLRIAVLRHAF